MRAEKSIQSLSRSDLVRQRRQQRSSQRVSQTRDAAARAVRSPSVVVRGESYQAARPIHQSARSRVKRQYYYSLGASGAELRLPALPMINLGWRVISAIVAVFTGLAVFALGFSTVFQISDVTVEGISRVTLGDIEAVLGARGTQVVTFYPKAAKSELELAFPELTDITIQIGLPAKITIKVTELQPAVAWKAGEQVYWIADNGVILPPRGEPGELLGIGSNTHPPLLALVEDEPSAASITPAQGNTDLTPTEIWGRQIDPVTMKRVLDLQTMVPPESKLVYSSENGLGWEEPSGMDVYIGRNLNDFDLKLSMYQAIMAKLGEQGITPQDMISVEFINAPFFR